MVLSLKRIYCHPPMLQSQNLNIEDFCKLEAIGIGDSLDVTDDDKAFEQFNK